MVGLGGGALYVPLLLALGFGFQSASSTSLFLIMITGFAAFLQCKEALIISSVNDQSFPRLSSALE